MPVSPLNNPVTRFFVYALALYLGWYLLYELYIKPHTSIDEHFVSLIISQSVFILRILGFKTYEDRRDEDMQIMGVSGAHPLWIGSPCNAITLFAFFTFFVIAFPGNNRHKFWFVPAGVLIIHLANLIRVVSLAILTRYAPDYLYFNHTYTFTIFVYAIIFCLWIWWVNFSLKKRNHEKKT